MKWLKYYREKAGLSLNKLAEMLGVQLNTVWRWESGRAITSVEMAKALAQIFGITESELLNGPGSQNWELKLVVSKTSQETEGGTMNLTATMDMTAARSTATLAIGDNAMGITLSAPYELWEDDSRFEELIEDIRRKRSKGLKMRREDW